MTEQVRYRIEQRLVREAEKVCDELGLSPSQVVSMTFAQLVRLRALPFRPSEFPALEEYGATLAEADAAEALLLGEPAELVRCGGVLWVDAAHAVKLLGVALEDAGQIAVVPLVVDDLNAHGAGNIVGVHQIQQHLDGCVLRRGMDARGKGERRIGLPHMHVRIDKRDRRGLRKHTRRECGSG